MTEPAAGTLYVVSTPIGNLGDLSARAVAILRGVDLILAEDTRHSRPLLDAHGITTRVESHHQHNEAASTQGALKLLREGSAVALITDAGTPLVSDPGGRLVRAAITAEIPVVPVPGASALLAALVGGGLPTDRFTFYGFLDRGGAARREALDEIAALRHTAVLYEAPNRVAALLHDLVEAGCGMRSAVVARELTKQFEEFARGTVVELEQRFADAAPRGEVVVLVGGAPEPTWDEASLRERARAMRAEGLSASDVARVISKECGAPRNLAYRIAHE